MAETADKTAESGALLSEEALAAYRSEVRAWLAQHVPRDWRAQIENATKDEAVDWDRAWLRELHTGGYAAPHWPVEFGGSGANVQQDIVLQQEFVRADAPWPATFYVSLNHAAHAIIRYGTEAQQEHLPRILAGEQIWCQAFSEPNAGSDLASLQTSAVRDGDHYVLNGQKIWSSSAHFADRGILLARTDPEAPKRAGITYFLIDIRTPGIDVRPIKKMTGHAEYCEIFLDDVVVPVSDRLGDENQGWTIARSSLSTERGQGFLRYSIMLQGYMKELLEACAGRGVRDARVRDAGHLRQTLARHYCEVEILARLCDRMLLTLVRTGGVGPEASIVKLFFSELNQRVSDSAAQLEGLAGQLAQPMQQRGGGRYAHWLMEHFNAYTYLIGAGTNEIQRNLIGERTLGLPREPAMQ